MKCTCTDTARHPDVPKHLRGTYAGLATPEVIEHLQQVGVTAVELLPVHHFVRDNHLIDRGLTNYWGYNSIGFFAPDIRYATSPDRAHHVWEFKTMVKALHNAGIEVILDVVYNHTGEGNHLGPTLSFRGIDNASYYRLVPDHPRFYQDYTGCGNTLNVRHPRVLQLIMDSLRTGCSKCMWTASDSISPPRWRGSCTTWTGSAHFSTSFIKIRCSRR